MEKPGLYERQRIQAVVEKGRQYASERPSMCADMRARIRQAEIAAVENLGSAFRVDPPSDRLLRGRIEYDPVVVTRLLADHTYPEWVIAAQLELLIGQHKDEWHAGAACAPGLSFPQVHAA
jgi:hypothetical protein